MKDYLKVILIAVVGGVTAIVLYPIIHETGHMIATIVFGGEVKELHLFPSAYVVCDMSNTKIFGRILVGLSGMLFPFLLSAFVQPKKFWSWYACFIIRGVCVLSFAISLVSIAMFYFGQEIQNEDIVQVMKIEPVFSGIYFWGLLILLCAEFVLIAKSHPVQKCMNYFEL